MIVSYYDHTQIILLIHSANLFNLNLISGKDCWTPMSLLHQSYILIGMWCNCSHDGDLYARIVLHRFLTCNFLEDVLHSGKLFGCHYLGHHSQFRTELDDVPNEYVIAKTRRTIGGCRYKELRYWHRTLRITLLVYGILLLFTLALVL